MGLLTKNRSAGELMARRGGAMAGVIALHAIVVGALLHMRHAERPEPVATAIRVVNLQTPERGEEPQPELPVELVESPPIDIVVPLVNIQLPAPPPTAITPPPPPVQARPVAVQHDGPVMLEVDEVDYLIAPAPRYTRSTRQARLQGVVLLWVLIDPEGRPKEVRVHRSSGHEQLDRQGREAVMAAQFKPYRRNGVALSAQVIVPVEFSLTVRTANRR